MEEAVVAEVAVSDGRTWRMAEEDIPWLCYLCAKRYGNKFSQTATEPWFRNTVLKRPLEFFPARTTNAFVISRRDYAPWLPDDPEVSVQIACADTGCMWELLRLMRDSITWAELGGCTFWRCCSDTEYDFAPIARRLGATEQTTRFVLRLK